MIVDERRLHRIVDRAPVAARSDPDPRLEHVPHVGSVPAWSRSSQIRPPWSRRGVERDLQAVVGSQAIVSSYAKQGGNGSTVDLAVQRRSRWPVVHLAQTV